MGIVKFEDGQLINPAHVIIDGVRHEITPSVYEGNTPLSSYNLNRMQEKILEDGIIVSPTEPVTDRRKVWMQKGKNFLNNNNLKVTSAWQANYSIDTNKKITAQCTGTSGVSYIRINSISLKAGTYTFSASISGQLQSIRVYKLDNTLVTTLNVNTGTFTLNEDAEVFFQFYIWVSASNSIAIQNIQIEQGEEATEYEAYVNPAIYIKNNNDIYEEFIKKEDNNDIYSIEETKTNKVWIDGKPIYRKVMSFVTASETYTMKTVDIGVENIDLCFIGPMSVIISGNSADNSLYMVNAVRANSDTALSSGAHNWFRINANKKQVAYVVSSLTASSKCFLELYYTKTTD